MGGERGGDLPMGGLGGTERGRRNHRDDMKS